MRLKKLAALLAAMALAGVLALSLTGCDKLPGVDAGVTGASQASDGRQTGGYALGKIGEKLTILRWATARGTRTIASRWRRPGTA